MIDPHPLDSFVDSVAWACMEASLCEKRVVLAYGILRADEQIQKGYRCSSELRTHVSTNAAYIIPSEWQVYMRTYSTLIDYTFILDSCTRVNQKILYAWRTKTYKSAPVSLLHTWFVGALCFLRASEIVTAPTKWGCKCSNRTAPYRSISKGGPQDDPLLKLGGETKLTLNRG
jgi:hypothetical protein